MKPLRLLRRVSLTVALVLTLILLLPHGVTTAASGFSLSTHVNYVVNGNITAVSEQYSVTNQTDREFLTEVTLTTPVDTITGVSAAYSDGANIPVTTGNKATNLGSITYNYQTLTLKFPRQIFGSGKSWSFNVHYYATGLVESHGGAHTVFVPQIQNDQLQGDYTARVDVPAGFGTPHFVGAKTSQVSSGGGRQYFDFNKAEISAQSLALSFGDQSDYRVNFNFPLVNSGRTSRTMEVTLPPDLNNQHVHIESLDPQPLNSRIDADGNVLADYRVAPGQHLTVKTVIIGQVNYLDYNLAASGKAKDIPADLVQKYTASTTYWQTGGQVGAVAKSLNDPNRPVIQNVQAMYQYVIDHLTYNPNKIKFNIRQGSAKALAQPNNVVCLEYSDLLIAMLRSQGIPARMPVGYGFSGSLKTSDSVVDSLHSWVEAYVPGIGWMTLDPTWGEKFDLFGQSDLDHFAFAVWGTKDQLPAPVMTAGRDDGYQYENTTLDYVNSTETVPAGGQLAITRRVILPGISLEQISAQAGGDQAGHYVVQTGGKNLDLGNLAPGQHITRYRWIIGRNWQSPATADLAETTASQSLVLAHTSVRLDWRILIGLAGIVAVGLFCLLMLRLRLHFRKKPPDTPTNG